jgi:ubiquinone/menaquinone biosynthesis C-methylase UbiE
VPALLEKGRARAAAEGLDIEFRVADAGNLPWQDGGFDVALSTFGVMFVPDHGRSAAELLRAGGRIALSSWMPGSFIGELFGDAAAEIRTVHRT